MRLLAQLCPMGQLGLGDSEWQRRRMGKAGAERTLRQTRPGPFYQNQLRPGKALLVYLKFFAGPFRVEPAARPCLHGAPGGDFIKPRINFRGIDGDRGWAYRKLTLCLCTPVCRNSESPVEIVQTADVTEGHISPPHHHGRWASGRRRFRPLRGPTANIRCMAP